MSLENQRIIVTRAPHQAGALVKMLKEAGAVPLIFPCIDIAPPQDVRPLDSALRNLKAYEWLIITSSNTALALHRRLTSLQIRPDWNQLKIAAVGETTAEAIQDYLGAPVQFIPDRQTAADLGRQMTIHDRTRVLLPQSALAKNDLEQGLRAAGADVTTVTAYETVIGSGGEDVPQLLADKQVDAVTFTSSSTVDNFMQRISPMEVYGLPAAVIGPSTAETAKKWGFSTIIMPEQYHLDTMMSALSAYFAERLTT